MVSRMKEKVLITGTAGFIGFHLSAKLVAEGIEVVGMDIINDYYDIQLKFARLEEMGIARQDILPNELLQSSRHANYRFIRADLADHDFIVAFMKEQQFTYVVNLAAQAGVRYSLENPRAYTRSNIDGFLSILEGCRYSGVKHLIFASSSSVYGLNTRMPLSEDMPTEHPMTLYAASKKANEMMAHTYSHLFGLAVSGLRFFTVYGPWGRPDMALFLFTDAILRGEPIQVFNHGKMVRDFTYVSDIVESITRLLSKPPLSDPMWDGDNPRISTSTAPYRIYNIGNSNPVELNAYIEAIEKNIGKQAIRNNLDMQLGDVPATFADVSSLEEWVGFKPSTTIEDGIKAFVEWYREFYQK